MRDIRHHGPDPDSDGVPIAEQSVVGCSFELHRQGGCGAGELRLARPWGERDQPPRFEIDDFLSIRAAGVRTYLGKIASRSADLTGGLAIALEGLSEVFNHVYPGERQPTGEPLIFGRPGLPEFRWDPYRNHGQAVGNTAQFNQITPALLLSELSVRYGLKVRANEYRPPIAAQIYDLVLHGEESARTILQDFAVRSGNVSWGVDGENRFFFHPPGTDAATPPDPLRLRVGREITRLEELDSQAHVYNRLQLIGGFIYDEPQHAKIEVRRHHQFVGEYFEPTSLQEHGARRLRINVPWIRSSEDAKAFGREFFRRYHRPARRYVLEAALPHGAAIPRPWRDELLILDERGEELTRGYPETVRVGYDRAITLRMEIGPEDPRRIWPDPPHQQRFNRPDHDRPGFERETLHLTDSEQLGSSSGSSGSSGSSALSSGENPWSSNAVSSGGESSDDGWSSDNWPDDGWSSSAA